MLEIFEHISDGYLNARDEPFGNHAMAKYLRHDASNRVIAELGELGIDLKVTGSAGQGQWAQIPWIAVFDPIVTTSATKGHYIVFLFSADMNRLYLSLNQGTTAAHEEFGSLANAELARRAELLRHRVPEHKEHFSTEEIDLGANGMLPIGYQAGHAFGKLYRMDELPFDIDPVSDLEIMVELYCRATARGGTDYLGETSHIDIGEEDLAERRRYRYHRRIERNARSSALAKQFHGYACQCCGINFFDQYGELGREYIEAHHLIPLNELPESQPVKLDPSKDFAVLCANCHRMMHRKGAPRTVEGLRKLFRKPLNS